MAEITGLTWRCNPCTINYQLEITSERCDTSPETSASVAVVRIHDQFLVGASREGVPVTKCGLQEHLVLPLTCLQTLTTNEVVCSQQNFSLALSNNRRIGLLVISKNRKMVMKIDWEIFYSCLHHSRDKSDARTQAGIQYSYIHLSANFFPQYMSHFDKEEMLLGANNPVCSQGLEAY